MQKKQPSDADIVRHKTFSTPDGGFRHEPLTRDEARQIWAECKDAEEKRRQLMPDEQSAINLLFDAYQRLKELGWANAIYCPKDGSTFDIVEAGSTGIHKCRYEGKWPTGHFWVMSDGDLWPSRPVLYRKKGG